MFLSMPLVRPKTPSTHSQTRTKAAGCCDSSPRVYGSATSPHKPAHCDPTLLLRSSRQIVIDQTRTWIMRSRKRGLSSLHACYVPHPGLIGSLQWTNNKAEAEVASMVLFQSFNYPELSGKQFRANANTRESVLIPITHQKTHFPMVQLD